MKALFISQEDLDKAAELVLQADKLGHLNPYPKALCAVFKELAGYAASFEATGSGPQWLPPPARTAQ